MKKLTDGDLVYLHATWKAVQSSRATTLEEAAIVATAEKAARAIAAEALRLVEDEAEARKLNLEAHARRLGAIVGHAIMRTRRKGPEHAVQQ